MMFTFMAVGYGLFLFIETCAVLVKSKEISHSDVGIAIYEDQPFTRFWRSKRELHMDSMGFNKKEKLALLQRHNYVRGQEGASNMMLMDWDKKLEKLAQKKAESCDFKHSSQESRSNTAGFSYVGENLYAISVAFYPVSVVQEWYDEKSFYSFNTGWCQPGQQCGHYTQIVWHTSKALGCGVKYCPHLTNTGNPTFTSGYNIVCHYGPGGNYRGQQPYSKGKPCSQCPQEAMYCVHGLCSKFAHIGSSGSDWIHSSKPYKGIIILSLCLLHFVLSCL